MKKLEVLNNMLAFSLYILKVVADYRRHASHQNHKGQRCECFYMCLPCLSAAAMAKKNASAE